MPDFGWMIPTGQQRMPTNDYPAHLNAMLHRIEGHFHAVWMPDHLMDGPHPIPEALTTLSYYAGQHPNLHFGTCVVGQGYRNPALLAKMAATVQHLSGGRFLLGMGAGWKQDEYTAYGYPFPGAATRIAELGEAVQIIKSMWTQPQTTFYGQHYTVEGAVCAPQPAPPPPVMIGGGGEKLTLRVVAEHADWWNLPGAPPAEYARKAEVLASHCMDVGRDPASIRKTWMGVVSIAPTQAQAEAQIADFPIWPGDVPLLGTPAQVREQIRAYTAIGVDLFVLSFVDEPGHAGIDLFVEEVPTNVN